MMIDHVPDYAVWEVIEKKTNKYGVCGICNGEIDTTTSLEHDRECRECGTKFNIVDRTDGGAPVYDLDHRTTPEQRIRRTLRQKANERLALEELAAGGDDTE